MRAGRSSVLCPLTGFLNFYSETLLIKYLLRDGRMGDLERLTDDEELRELLYK